MAKPTKAQLKKVARAGVWVCTGSRVTGGKRYYTESLRLNVPGQPRPKIKMRGRKRALRCKLSRSTKVAASFLHSKQISAQMARLVGGKKKTKWGR